MDQSNIIITGLPRSGTTLTCHLLNKVDNMVALHEPMTGGFAPGASNQQICAEIAGFFKQSRQSILEDRQVVTNHINGKVPDNSFGEERDENGLRKNLITDRQKFMPIDKALSADFMLCIKHNGLFAFLLKDLAQLFPCYAIIRNPLALLASWNSVNLSINDGHIPVAEKLDAKLRESLSAMPDKIDRQLHVLSWFFNHYKNVPAPENILRYEDIVASGGSVLRIVSDKASGLSEKLESKNLNHLYDKKLMVLLGERLLATEGDYWDFYAKQEVTLMLSEILK